MNASRPIPLADLRAKCAEMGLTHFRLAPLPEVARDFGHSTVILDRVASEHSAVIVELHRRREGK